MMCRMLEAIGGRVYKTYRIYERRVVKGSPQVRIHSDPPLS